MSVFNIKDLCSTLKATKYRNMDNNIKKCFEENGDDFILNELLSFSNNNPQYRKILTRVVKHLKEDVLCVYLLIDKGKVVYVGKSKDLCSRLSTHAKTKNFDEVKVIKLEDLKSQSLCENSLILKYKPKYNKLLDLKDTNLVLDFDKDSVDFKVWLSNQFWFSSVSLELQSKIGTKVIPKGYLVFVDEDIKINFKYEESATLCYEEITSVRSVNKPMSASKYLKQAAEDLGKPELFSVVTNSTYKFGDFYITDGGKWRVAGKNTWYSNVDLEKIVKDTTDSFNSLSLAEPENISVIWFGKYKGQYYKDVLLIDPSYCEWVLKTFKKHELIKLGATT